MLMRTAVVLTAFTLVFAVTTEARAQGAVEKAQARALMDQGDAKREAKDYEAALKAYTDADNIMHVPSTAIEVARMQVQVGKLLEARDTLERLKNLPVRPNEPPAFGKARKDGAQLADELNQRIPAIQVVVTGAEPGQTPEVTIDNEATPASSPKKVNPGAHTVRVKLGTDEKSEDVTVSEKETKTVSIELKSKEPSKKVITTDDDPGGGNGTGKILTFGGFGLAIVGVGVGTVTGIMSMSKVSDIKNDCTNDKCLPSRASDIDSAKTLGNISTVAFVVAGAGVVTGVVGLLMSSRGKADTTAVIRPSFNGLAGTF